MTLECTTLKSGLRIITDHVPSVESVALGVWCAVGTRHEDMNVNGVAHMVEHMMFKGTKTRNAQKIAEEIEDVGGHMNAYTSRDITAYHIHALKEHAGLAVNFISDILQHSTLPEDEIERERGVIIQEIGMYLDTPDETVFDDYQRIAFPDQTLGAPILGTADIIAALPAQALRDYITSHYTPANLVLSASGNIRHDDLVAMAEDNFNARPPDKPHKIIPARYQGGEHRAHKDLEQSHIVLGFPSISRHDPRYYSAVALSTILGGGMASRLFQEIREKRGLVYSVYSFHTSYDDCGQLTCYAGTDPERQAELIPVLCAELKRMGDASASASELKRVKTQMRSNLLMARESMMTRAGQQAKHAIYFKDPLDIPTLLEKIEAVTLEDIRNLAQEIFSQTPTLSALGPLDALEPYEAIRSRLAA
jgi:predicted Zn-dependent peptidase